VRVKKSATEWNFRLIDASGDNWTSFANPEFDAGRFVMLEACLSWKFKNDSIGSQHERASTVSRRRPRRIASVWSVAVAVLVPCFPERSRFALGFEGLSQTTKADRFVFMWSVAVAIFVPCFPERVVEFPEKVDELANPESTSEATSVDLEGEKERVLCFSPLARKAPSE
jgi:hypothetical protein